MEMQMTEGPYRGDASAGSPNLHHHPVANHLVSTILKGAYFSNEDEEELHEIEASMDALDMNIDYDGERTTSTNVIPKIPHELCEGTEFRQGILKICEKRANLFSREVPMTTAKVTPNDIACDVTLWNTKHNRTGP